jgi:hypothetical protein
MKTYTVLYAEDVPHYGAHEIQAENDAGALDAAIGLHKRGGVTLDDAQWSGAVCARIVHIADEDGHIIEEDRPLDDYFLGTGGTAARLLCDAAAEMLNALEDSETFIAGFEDDECQEGMDKLLGTIRTAIAKARGRP